MKKYTVLLILVSIFVLFCACGNAVSDDVTPTPTAIATPTHASTPTATPTSTNTPTPTQSGTPTPIPFHQTFESLVFDGEYTHEKLIELVTDFAIASDNKIFEVKAVPLYPNNPSENYIPSGGDFSEDNLFKLFIYRQGRLYSQNARGQFVIPVKDVIDFLVDRHFCDPVTINEKEFFSPLLPLERFVFDPSLVTIADYDREKNVLILDNIPSINITPFAYNVKLLTDIHSSVNINSSLCFSGTYMDGNQEEKEFHFSIGTDCKKNKENLPEIMWIVFRSYSWCGHRYS